MSIHSDAQTLVKNIVAENMPQQSVEKALTNHEFSGNVYLVSIGKAAWTMAKTVSDFLGDKLVKGIVVTKYKHSGGALPRIEIYEAGHPVSDDNTISATRKCIELVKDLGVGDELLFLVSGGGSALFEAPLDGMSLSDIQDIQNQLLASGADIVEINMIRKRFSAVKAGRFAQIAAPAKVFAIMLSDVLGDRPDSIASGPAVPDYSTAEDALKVAKKYNLKLSDLMQEYLRKETPKEIDNVTTVITGSVRTLCESAAKTAEQLGYTPFVLTTQMSSEASEVGKFIASIANDISEERSFFKRPCAIIAGGETVVTLKGNGLGGRNQELALAAASGISGLKNILIFSLGSDGTDGPTDAAGGIVDGETAAKLKEKGFDIDAVLAKNDSYNALFAIDGLITTGPTGTNVNDVTVILCK